MSELREFQDIYPKATCANCGMSDLCISSGLTGPELDRLNALIAQRIKVKKGDALYRMGEPLRSIYAVRIGSFKTSLVSVNGYEQVTGFQMPGEVLGLDAISTNQHVCNAFGLEDSEVCPINFTQLEKLARDLPTLQHNLNKLLSRQIVHDHRMLMLISRMSSDARLAAFLLDLSRRLNVRGYSARQFVLKMSREEISIYLGLRLETISRCIAHLRDQGLLEISGRNVKILDMEGLKNLTAGCHENV